TQYQNGGLSLLAPDLLYAELGNIIWKKHLFQGLAQADGQLILDAFRQLTLQITPSSDLLIQAYSLATTHKRSVYDSLYLALGLREQCRVVTADEKLVNALSGSFAGLTWV